MAVRCCPSDRCFSCRRSLDFRSLKSVTAGAGDDAFSPPAARAPRFSGLRSVPGRAFCAAPDRRRRKMPKLSDTQAVLLAAAAARAELSCPARARDAQAEGRRARAKPAGAARSRLDRRGPRGPDAMRRVGRANGKRLVITPAGLDAIGVENQPRRRPVRRYGVRSRAADPEARRRATGRQARAFSWMRSRVRRERPSKNCPPPRAGCRIPPAPPSPGSASAATTCGSRRSGTRKVYHLIPAV